MTRSLLKNISAGLLLLAANNVKGQGVSLGDFDAGFTLDGPSIFVLIIVVLAVVMIF